MCLAKRQSTAPSQRAQSSPVALAKLVLQIVTVCVDGRLRGGASTISSWLDESRGQDFESRSTERARENISGLPGILAAIVPRVLQRHDLRTRASHYPPIRSYRQVMGCFTFNGLSVSVLTPKAIQSTTALCSPARQRSARSKC